MSFTITHYPLSALNPVEIEYSYNSTEKLNGNFQLYTSGLRAYNYEVFKNFKDAALSKKTAIVLTSIKDLKQVFAEPFSSLNVGSISGSCYLNVANNSVLDGDVFLKLYNNELFVGGKGQQAVFNLIPIDRNIVELKVENFYVQVEEEYPYEIKLSNISLPENEISRQRFSVAFSENFITFKTETKDGPRYLSYTLRDRKLKCVGIQLNAAIINEYLLQATFVSTSTIEYGYKPTTTEVKYFNSFNSGEKQKNVEVFSATPMNTNLLITLPSSSLVNNKITANINLLKTNYSNSGAFNSTL